MTEPTHRGRVRLQSYVEPPLADRVHRYCTAMGVTESAIVKSALEQYLDQTGDPTLLLRRVDRLGRAVARVQRDLEILSHAFGVFTRLWLAHTPRVPNDAKPGARLDAEGRYRDYVEHVCEEFNGGRRFLDDLSREVVANDAELDAIAENTGTPGGRNDHGNERGIRSKCKAAGWTAERLLPGAAWLVVSMGWVVSCVTVHGPGWRPSWVGPSPTV